MARFYGPIQQNPGGGEIIEIEPTSLPTDAVILTNPVDGKNNQEDANQYFYEELQNKADAGHTHGTDGDGNEIDTSNLVTKDEFTGSQDAQDSRLDALEAGGGMGSGPHTHDEYADAQELADHLANHPEGGSYDDSELRGLIQGNTDALDDKSDTTHTHDTTHDHNGLYSPTTHLHDDLYQPKGNYALQGHTHDGVGGEPYDDTELRGLIEDNATAIEGKADDPHTHEDLAYDDSALTARVSATESKNTQQDQRLGPLEAKQSVLQDDITDLYNITAGKSDTGHTHDADSAPHTHTEYAPTEHDHDYLTELPTHDHPHDHTEYASADDVTALWVLANSNESKANANTAKNEEQDDRLDALESGNEQGDSTIFYQNTNSNIYQDGVPGSPSPQGWQGWHYASAGDGTKINWYFYAQDFSNPEVFTGELNSFAILVVPETSNTRLPHITVYTMPQGDGQDAQVWYRSRATYENTGQSWTANQPYVVYYGQDPEIFENYPRVELTKADYTSEGPQQDGEGIFLLAIGSDSSAAADAYNFTLQQSHVDSVDYVQNAVFLAPTSVEAYLAEGGTTYASALAIEEDINNIEEELESVKGRPKPKTDEIPLSDDDEGIFFGDDVVHTQHDVNEVIYDRLLNTVKSTNVTSIVSLSQEEFDAIVDKDPSTLYLVV